MEALIYDIEIVKAIPNKDGSKLAGIEYCAGWQDHANMGVATLCAYDYKDDRYRVFCKDNLADFIELAKDRMPVGFNNIAFDSKVLNAVTPFDETGQYDLLVEIWAACGLGPTFNFKTHGGFGLDIMCETNFGTKKTGHGALAPVDWQRGNIGAVIDYCLNDIKLTKQLFDEVLAGRDIKNPKGGTLMLRCPYPAILRR